MESNGIKITHAFVADSWLYLVYSNNTIARKYLLSKTPWESVETPEVRQEKVDVEKPREPSTTGGLSRKKL